MNPMTDRTRQGLTIVAAALAVGVVGDVLERTVPEERVRYLYRLLFGREAEADEVTLSCQLVASAEEIRKLKGWDQLAQVLLLSNEFAFLD